MFLLVSMDLMQFIFFNSSTATDSQILNNTSNIKNVTVVKQEVGTNTMSFEFVLSK